ncbi:MAG: hypothetical protein ACMVO5_07810 [Polymorphobacter sp.]|uniref:hypothetical protein n=1 Tax=Polymorphobacter sp. TaxID=1909290 RepID=UPI003A89CA30
MRAVWALLLMAALLGPAGAARAAGMIVPVAPAAAAALKPDRAYLLVRALPGSPWPTLLRIPDDAELAAYDAARAAAFAKAEPELRKTLKPGEAMPGIDSFAFDHDAPPNLDLARLNKPLEKGEGLRTHLFEVPPGDYVIYGVGFGNALHTCLCLGTLGFTARAGEILDMGDFLAAQAWKASDVPELAGETGLGASVNGHVALWAAAIRPSAPGRALPAALAGRAVVPAAYRAVGKFVSPLALNINHLTPLAGVLDYRDGVVIDGATGQPVADVGSAE